MELSAGDVSAMHPCTFMLAGFYLGQMIQAPHASPHAGTLRGNWEAFWLNVDRDHAHAGLIWNAATRTELREALQVLVGS